MNDLKLSAYQQDALAALAQAAAAVHWQMFGKHAEPTADQLAQFAEVVERFDRINWGEIYDKMHRSGANA